jgi:predicted Fe-S protein YdhL (DUF1289 family)
MKKTECSGMCSLDRDQQKCNGCNRTIEDLQNWRYYTLEERVTILEETKDA